MERTLFVGSYTEPGSVVVGGTAADDGSACATSTEGPAGITAVRIGDDGLLTSVRVRSNTSVPSGWQAGDPGPAVADPGPAVADPGPTVAHPGPTVAHPGPDAAPLRVATAHPGADAWSVGDESATPVRNPSFLAVDGRFVYAVEELADGRVVSLHRDDLTMVSRVSSGGADPCHLVSLDGNLVVANYGSGTVAVVPAVGGVLAAPVHLAGSAGNGPVQDRQAGAHAHQVTVTDWGTVLVCDLGADRVEEYSSGTDGRLILLTSIRLPPGTGPRHLVPIPDGVLVVGELDARLHHLRRSGEQWEWLSATSVIDSSHPDLSTKGGAFPSHLQLSADGSLVYTTVRGRDSISVMDVSGVSAGVLPKLLVEVPCGGHWPRHFTLTGNPAPAPTGNNTGDNSGDVPGNTPGNNSSNNSGSPTGSAADTRLYIANERSHRISVFAIGADGVPDPLPLQQFAIDAPACVVVG